MWKYFFFVLYALIGAILTWAIIEHLVKPYIKKASAPGSKKGSKPLQEVPWIVFFSGMLEIILYGGSFLAGKPEFIVVWIGFKIALKWDRKISNTHDAFSDTERRGFYHSNLLGTALNIVFGYIAACLIKGEFIVFT
jgi:hypothetical protein